MRGLTNKQFNLMGVILAPVRILGRAKDFYVKSLMNCAGMASRPSSQTLLLPKSLSINSSKIIDKEEFRELLKSISGRRSTEMESNLHKRSYSIGVGKIGRIDEDRPCSFRENIMKADSHPRSVCHAIRINAVYH